MRTIHSFLTASLVCLLIVSSASNVEAVEAEVVNVLSGPNESLCGGPFPEARAEVLVDQAGGKTLLRIKVRSAAPSTAYTVWLRLAPPFSPVALSPMTITPAPVTPAANPEDLADLATITPNAFFTALGASELGPGDDGSGGLSQASGFITDANGNGELRLLLDFPLVKGAYPFNEATSGDPIAFSDTPYILRIASHCTDQVFHGLLPMDHEPWWDVLSVPFESKPTRRNPRGR